MAEPIDLGPVIKLRQQLEDVEKENRVLKQGGSGGTSGGMDGVDAKIAAAEARVDTKFAELRGDLNHFATKGTVWGAAGTAVAIGLAVAAFGGDRFDAGMGASSTMASYSNAQRQRDAAQDKKLDQILSRLPAAQEPEAQSK